ncbi:MAG: gluconate 2-dehydrogenase subunit 3 family protein [Gammaproteobacteria bacterium]|nr:gluconate 2-dehydrogenase subunit 3 family protein [Gammaproteobacteria bacterium]
MNTPFINRRQFIQILAVTSTAWPLLTNAEKLILGQDTDKVYKNLSDPWLSLAEVQEHLFPADENSPGAKDIYALRFLRNMLDAPDIDAEEKDFIIQGVGWLNDLSVKNHKYSFIKLSSDNKEKVLRKIESSRAGSRWLSLMMGYLLEALLSDPVYGGNKESKGWLWLEHIPGFPTPTTEQVYFKLGTESNVNTRRRTKA